MFPGVDYKALEGTQASKDSQETPEKDKQWWVLALSDIKMLYNPKQKVNIHTDID